jgi:3-oxoacyl-[acyl-carrier protein] reductase
MDLGLDGRKALVTGGSQGIGRACAEYLANEGVDVAICARDADRLAKAAAEIAENRRGEVYPIQGDLTKPDELGRIIADATAALGQIDILVNNAGSAPAGRVQDFDDSIWQSSIDLKLMGYIRCARAVLPPMRVRRWGRIVNVIGRGGHQPAANYILGGAINAALINITQALAEDAGPDQVLVNGVNPASTATTRWTTLVEQKSKISGVSVEELSRQAASSTPTGRIGTPEDIAAAVVFLCSDQASHINGAMINVDGGRGIGG